MGGIALNAVRQLLVLAGAPFLALVVAASVASAAAPLATLAQAAPTPTVLPPVEQDTTRVRLMHVDLPPSAGRTANTDVIEIDQAAHLLYIADRTTKGLDVFDVVRAPARYLRTIPVGANPNGVVAAGNVQKVYAGLSTSELAVIDANPASPTFHTLLTRLNTGGRAAADELDYDPADKKVYVANADGFVTAVDATTDTILKRIDGVGRGLEQPRYNPGDGMVYVSAADDNAIVRLDPAGDQIVARFALGVPCAPHGLAINPATSQGVVACGSTRQPQTTLAFDFRAGTVLAVFEQVGNADMAIYDPASDCFFVAARSFYRGGQMGIFSGAPIRFLTNVPTAVGSNSVAFDQANHLVYTVDKQAGAAGVLAFPLPAAHAFPATGSGGPAPVAGGGPPATRAASQSGWWPAAALAAAGAAWAIARRRRPPQVR